MSLCQKCGVTIPEGTGRWMFTPTGAPPALHLDKCQPCGAWLPAEEALATENLKRYLTALNTQRLGGCNCAGKR